MEKVLSQPLKHWDVSVSRRTALPSSICLVAEVPMFVGSVRSYELRNTCLHCGKILSLELPSP